MTTVGSTFRTFNVWCRNEFNSYSQRTNVEGIEGMYFIISLIFVGLQLF